MKSIGLFLTRCVVGGTLAAHGFQKLFGAFGGGGLDATAESFEKMGFHPARQSALASGIAEGVGGSLLVLGAATPIAAAALAGNLAVAASVHRPNGFSATEGGLELPANLAAAAAGLALTGPGSLSVDRLFKHRYSKGWIGLASLAAAGAVAANLVQRREQMIESGQDDSGPSSNEEGESEPTARSQAA